MRRATLLMTIVMLAAACSDDGFDEISLAEAARQVDSTVVDVAGFLIFGPDEVRICEALAESFPPQCGGDSLVVDVLEPGLLESRLSTADTGGDLNPEVPVRWTDEVVMISGQMQGGRLQFVVLVGS